MKSEFSESSFAFCHNSNIVEALRNMNYEVMPFFPTLRDEAYLGFDVCNEIAVKGYNMIMMIQYKTIERVQSVKNGYPDPHLKFGIRSLRTSRQHNILIELREQRFEALYCVPLFISNFDLFTLFNRNAVIDSSAYIDPSSNPIGRVSDNLEHYIYLNTDGSNPAKFSDKFEMKSIKNISEYISHLETKKLDKDELDRFTSTIKEVLVKSKMMPEKPGKKEEHKQTIVSTIDRLRDKAGIYTFMLKKPANASQ